MAVGLRLNWKVQSTLEDYLVAFEIYVNSSKVDIIELQSFLVKLDAWLILLFSICEPQKKAKPHLFFCPSCCIMTEKWTHWLYFSSSTYKREYIHWCIQFTSALSLAVPSPPITLPLMVVIYDDWMVVDVWWYGRENFSSRGSGGSLWFFGVVGIF